VRVIISEAAVLVTAFNRPEETRNLLQSLCGVVSAPVYVAIDGPRPGNTQDGELVRQVLDVVGDLGSDLQITLIKRSMNLGCGASPREAITQVLSNEFRVIVLEDDCLPSLDFLPWANELLNWYERNHRVGAICGFQSAPKDLVPQDKKWWASRYFASGGWGTWRRVWSSYAKDLTGWRQEVSLAHQFRASGYSVSGLRWLRANWDWVEGREADVWDHQFGYTIASSNQIVLKPPVSLIENHGFNAKGTHTTSSDSIGAKVRAQRLPVTATEPGDLKVVTRADRWVLKHDYQARSTAGWLSDVARSAMRSKA
jgi:hypothetical protein